MLHPDEQRSLAVRFRPEDVGAAEEHLRFHTAGGPAAGEGDVLLLGAGGVRGRLVVPKPVDVGDVPVGEAASAPFELFNPGDVPLTLTRFKPPGDGVWSLGRPLDEGAVVPPHGVLRAPLGFRPVEAGVRSAQVELNADDGVGRRSVALSGRGVAPVVEPPAGTTSATGAPPSAGPAVTSASPGQTGPAGRAVAPLPSGSRAPGRVTSAAVLRQLVVTGGPRSRRLHLIASAPVTVRVSLAKRRAGRWVPLRGSRTQALRAGAAVLALPEPWAGRRLRPGRYRVLVRAGTRVSTAEFVRR